jgi:hypothetical protein
MIDLILKEIDEHEQLINFINSDGYYQSGYVDALQWVLKQLPEEG